jgi:perosamine synthetase
MENIKKIPLSLPFIGEEEKKAVCEVLDSGWLAHGEYNSKLEHDFAQYIGVKHSITMNSCTSAIEIALKINKIKGEVIIPSFTFVATANAVVTSGAIPVFADVEINSRNITAEHIKEKLNKNTEAIIIVHYAGQICEMDKITELCKIHGLLLIEDSAETIGATWNGKQAGSFGIGCFSFFPTKNMTTGEGGILTVNDDKLAENARAMISHGIFSTTISREKEVKQWLRAASIAGHNYRMSNILAAIGYEQLKKIDLMNNKRVDLAHHYNNKINKLGYDIKVPTVKDGATHVYQMYTVQVPENRRDNIVINLRNKGIGASVHFEPPVHLQEYYKQKYNIIKGLTNTEKLSRTLITLPIYPAMTKDDVNYISNTLKEIY